MVEIKISLCAIFCFCCFAVEVFTSRDLDSLKNLNPSLRRIRRQDSECSVSCADFRALENKNWELEKVVAELKQYFILLRKDVNNLKNEESSWILKPLRGPPGEKGRAGQNGFEGRDGRDGQSGEPGVKGESGLNGSKGERGEVGSPGQRGQTGQPGPAGNPGTTGSGGEKGERGQNGSKGEIGQPGLTGNQGVTGSKGANGVKGERGEVGPPGQRGQVGQPGPTGEKGVKGDRGISALESITSCSDAMKIFPSSGSKTQLIYAYGDENKTSLEVLCDFQVDGGGWTVIQKRSAGPRQEFNRTWDEYSNGFGSLDKNFWLGFENIRALTKNGDQELRIELEDFQGNKAWAKYSSFSISDASDSYRLEISGFDGNSTARDSMTNSVWGSNYINNGMKFSTRDKDNDLRSWSCVQEFSGGGWWFNSCGARSHLNGPYKEKGESGYGIHWYSWKQSYESLAKAEMKIRKRK